MIFVKDTEDRYVRVDGGVPVVWEVRDSGGAATGYQLRVNGGPGATLRTFDDRDQARRALEALVDGVADKVHEL